jgi:hypothetical protein
MIPNEENKADVRVTHLEEMKVKSYRFPCPHHEGVKEEKIFITTHS